MTTSPPPSSVKHLAGYISFALLLIMVAGVAAQAANLKASEVD